MMLVWFWCVRCGRAFSTERDDANLDLVNLPADVIPNLVTSDCEVAPTTCPFDCESAAEDIWLYWEFQKVADYPPWMDCQNTPRSGVRYPVNPTPRDVSRIEKEHEILTRSEEILRL